MAVKVVFIIAVFVFAYQKWIFESIAFAEGIWGNIIKKKWDDYDGSGGGLGLYTLKLWHWMG